MKRNMTATVMALAMSTVMTAAVLSGCGGTPKELSLIHISEPTRH